MYDVTIKFVLNGQYEAKEYLQTIDSIDTLSEVVGEVFDAENIGAIQFFKIIVIKKRIKF